MSVPNKIKINREEEYYTHYIDRSSDGTQFIALIGATLPMLYPEDWENHKRWYAILHLFDSKGNHKETKTIFTGCTSDGEDEVVEKAREERNKLIAALGNVTYEDVEVCLFSVEVDGFTFGLVDGSSPEEGIEKIGLLPNDLAFFEPWDGEYDT